MRHPDRLHLCCPTAIRSAPPSSTTSSPGSSGSWPMPPNCSSSIARSCSSATTTSSRPTPTSTSPSAGLNDALFAPEAREQYAKLLTQGWTDAHPQAPPRRADLHLLGLLAELFERDAGIRIDHLLLNPKLAKKLKAAGVDRTPRGGKRPATTRRSGSRWRFLETVAAASSPSPRLRWTAIPEASACQPKLQRRLVPDAGVEPATFGLQNRCSTN